MRWLPALLMLMPAAAFAADKPEANDAYGMGLLCPRAEGQITFYTEGDQQDAAGTLAFQNGQFTLTSSSVRDVPSSGAHLMESLCEGGATGIRIDAKRDGWLQAGSLWIPPNQDWDYADWQDILRKAPVWKPLVPVTLYQGSIDAPYKNRPYMGDKLQGKFDIYPIKFADDFALVLVDSSNALAQSCTSDALPPTGRLGWMRLSVENGTPAAVPAHAKGC